MIVQLEDFETQSNVDKAVVRSDNTKLVTLTDLVPTPPGTKGQEISKYLFEQPAKAASFVREMISGLCVI